MIVSDSSIIRVNRFSLLTFRPDQRSRKDCSRSSRPYNRAATWFCAELTDFTGAAFDRDALRAMKEATVFDKAFVKKSAFIGTENFPREFYEELKSFSRRELLIFTIRQKQSQDP